jgi:hypothetical protein
MINKILLGCILVLCIVNLITIFRCEKPEESKKVPILSTLGILVVSYSLFYSLNNCESIKAQIPKDTLAQAAQAISAAKLAAKANKAAQKALAVAQKANAQAAATVLK